MLNARLYLVLGLLIALTAACKKEKVEEKENQVYELQIAAIAIQDNIVWVGTAYNGLYSIHNELVTHYTTTDGLLSDTIRALCMDANANLWIGTNMGISKFKDGIWTDITTMDGLFNNDIRFLQSDQTNNIWIGTRKNRLEKYDGSGFTTYHVNPDASGIGELGHIHTISCDLDGNMWVGSCISGLSKFDGENWTDNINGLLNFVSSSACNANGDIWIGHYTGAYKFSNDLWAQYTTADGLADNDVSCFTFDGQNNIWIGTAFGLSKYDGASWTTLTTDNGLANSNITALACDNDGNIWIGSSAGLQKIQL